MKKLLVSLLAPAFLMAVSYEINFVGLKDEAALKSIFDVSNLVLLQDRPPASVNGLRYRIASDIPAILKVLRAYGYYDATISSDVEMREKGVEVSLFIQTGPQYILHSYEVFKGDCREPAVIEHCGPFTPKTLGLQLDAPAISFDLINAELNLLTELARCGYPLASVEKRRVVVDMAAKFVEAAVCIKEGPFSKFGPLSIIGLDTVKSSYVMRRIAWQEGDPYNPDAVDKTQKRLLNSNLFSSVMMTHGNELDAQGELPMKVHIAEAKHKQISVGAYYATVDGPGVVFSWTNRNLRGLGEILNVNGDVSKRYIAGKITYKKPDFWIMDQTYRAVAAIEREAIHAYTAFTYSLGNFLDRQIGEKGFGSMGLEIAHYNVADSARNGTYSLMDLPLMGKYNNADEILNPTKGYTVVYQATPFQSLENGAQHFFKQRLTTTFYVPLGTKNVILATRVQLGSIAGAKQKYIPLPLLFIGGSEDDLRGYRYKTVSPLNEHRKPFGGRSAAFLSLEARFRFGKKVGVVPFADFGTVTFSQLPQFDRKWFKSVGLGLRYFTFFGPLRADIGFPLDRREGVDPFFNIYASIGQAF